ncbi:MAG: DUF5694 domain-containing protein [Pyrinomonadaceae bacterium]
MKTITIVFLLAILGVQSLDAQVKGTKRIEILLLGSFHFAQTGADDDMMSVKRQNEIGELVKKIARFKPDKIFIERNPEFEYTNKMDEKYRNYLDDKYELSANEIYQIGFRVGKILGHKRIFQADHPGRYGSIYRTVEEYARKNGQTEILQFDAIGTTKPLYRRGDEDAIRKKKTVLDFIRYINSSEYQTLDHAAYVSAYPRIGDTRPPTSANEPKDYDVYFVGADLVADWYTRNIKIYSKVLTQMEFTEKRILIVYGNGHIPILRHLFESNPVFKVETTSKWLK